MHLPVTYNKDCIKTLGKRLKRCHCFSLALVETIDRILKWMGPCYYAVLKKMKTSGRHLGVLINVNKTIIK